jgi:hypothetical protein
MSLSERPLATTSPRSSNLWPKVFMSALGHRLRPGAAVLCSFAPRKTTLKEKEGEETRPKAATKLTTVMRLL